MNKNTGLYIAIGVLAIVVIALGFLKPIQVVIQNPLGATAGPNFTNTQYFQQGFDTNSIGGLKGVLDSTATTSVTYTAAQILDYSIINRPTTANPATSTLPSASALQDAGLRVGAYKDVLFRNTGNATTTIVFTAGASTTLQYASSSSATIPGGDAAILRFYFLTKTSGTNMVEVQMFESFH